MNNVPTPANDALVVDHEHPFLGLDSYSEKDQDYFYGRKQELEDLFRMANRGGPTVLFGISGLGKTSLLQAGLYPLFRESSYLPIHIRLTYNEQDPDLLTQVKNIIGKEIRQYCIDTPVPEQQQTFWEYFHNTPFWSDRNRLLNPILVFDQFEEIFTLGRDNPDTQSLLQALGDVIENRIPLTIQQRLKNTGEELPFNFDKVNVKVIFSLREDYLPDFEQLKHLMPSIVNNRYRLKRMNGIQAMEAILNPGGHLVSDDVATEIVWFVAGKEVKPERRFDKIELEPAILSLVCRELNNRRIKDGQSKISTKLLENVRGSIMVVFYEDSISDMPNAIRTFIEEDLLTASGYRSTRALDDAFQYPGVTENQINSLVGRRLLRVEERLGIPHVELIHDVLTKAIQQSRESRHQKESERNKLKEVWKTVGVGVTGVISIAIIIWGSVAYNTWLETRPWGYVTDIVSGSIHYLNRAKVSVGRSTDENPSDIDIPNRLVSRLHLFLYKNNYLALDVRSLNGTTINGEYLPYGKSRNLTNNDIFVLANIAPFQFSKIEYGQFQLWTPKIAQRSQLVGWGVVIDGAGKNYFSLTNSNYYFIHQNDIGFSLTGGKTDNAFLTIKKSASDQLPFIIRYLNNDKELKIVVKKGPYNYDPYELRSGIDIEIPGGSFSYKGLFFELIPVRIKNESISAYNQY